VTTSLTTTGNRKLDGDSISEVAIEARDFPQKISILIGSGVNISKKDISPKGIVYLRKLAAYYNPEFYAKQAMRMSTFNIPRMTVVYEENEESIRLPKGLYETITDKFKRLNIPYEIELDEIQGEIIDVEFSGVLRAEQYMAFENLTKYNTGVLSATTGFGKTVIGSKLICDKKCSTLILVHTKELATQWIERLEQFLKINYILPEEPKKRGRKKEIRLIGQLGGGKKQLTGKIDVAIMQSMFENDKTVKNLVDDYGMIIVDECHHVASTTFSRIMSRVKSKYIYGLTATPIRKDGHHPIIFMYCGPIRHKVNAKEQAKKRHFDHFFVPRFTSCRKPLYIIENDWSITDIMKHICESVSRNQMIISDVDELIKENRHPIILTDRKAHIDELKLLMKDKSYEVLELSGQLKVKERKEVLGRIKSLSDDSKAVIIATGKLVGEGFDLPWLDTLVMATPISWKGRVAQYAGRLHREYEGKDEVRILDYIDIHIPKLEKMYTKRLPSYKSIGYSLKTQNLNSKSEERIFSGSTFYSSFIENFKSVNKSIVISSPFIQKRKYEQIKDELIQMYNRGIRVIVYVKDIEDYSEKYKYNIWKIISEMTEAGIDVYQIPSNQYKFAIIDNEVVWYGGVDLLGGNRDDVSVVRIISSELANELQGSY
jgi:superfamily II DNA or RNA helicase